MICTHCGGEIKDSDPIVDVHVRICHQGLDKTRYTGVSYHPQCFPGNSTECAHVHDECQIVLTRVEKGGGELEL